MSNTGCIPSLEGLTKNCSKEVNKKQVFLFFALDSSKVVIANSDKQLPKFPTLISPSWKESTTL